METIDERTALCALNRVFGFLPAVGHALLEGFGSAAAVFRTPPERLQEALGRYRDLAPQLDGGILDWARGEMDRIFSGGFRFIGFGEEDYPSLLAECPDPPLGLYLNACSSPSEVFEMRPCIAVVGTRDLSPYGRDWCRRLVHAMAGADTPPCIVSGLAFGADAVAHRTALECGLPTVGVMATGIERIYPWQHEELAAQMVRTPGCAVVTDYPSGTSPVALNFVRRNRIIAGLARATVVIETKTKGGSLITAKYANDYDRDVYALPGRADDVRSAGCNSLIRQRMADIVTDPEDLAERLGLGRPARRRKAGLEALLTRRYGPGSPLVQMGLLVKSRPGISLEEIARETGWAWNEVMERSGQLETDGFLETDLLRRCTIPAKNM
ncbi:MAG: DNA-processing protein DprA [Bacteroidales bacterium]|nr:DNA-processing protein DprA [Bacteroidales bacterium]